jgi:hypothetical protein
LRIVIFILPDEVLELRSSNNGRFLIECWVHGLRIVKLVLPDEVLELWASGSDKTKGVGVAAVVDLLILSILIQPGAKNTISVSIGILGDGVNLTVLTEPSEILESWLLGSSDETLRLALSSKELAIGVSIGILFDSLNLTVLIEPCEVLELGSSGSEKTSAVSICIVVDGMNFSIFSQPGEVLKIKSSWGIG